MAFDPTLATALDRIRLLIADTETPELVADATITALIAAGGTEKFIAAKLCRDLALRLAKRGDVRNLSLSVGMGPAEFYRQRAVELESEAFSAEFSAAGGVVVGGLTKQEFATQRSDPEVRQPPFTFDQEDHPET